MRSTRTKSVLKRLVTPIGGGFSIVAAAAAGCSLGPSVTSQLGSLPPGAQPGGEEGGECLGCDFADGSAPFTSNGLEAGVTTPLTPTFEGFVTASVPPPPISGGTLIVTSDGTHAVASDPDRDSVYVVDLQAQTVSFTVPLSPGDEPGRLVEDGAGRVHVALRSGGALVTIDPTSGAVLERRAVCPAPRGVAWDSSTDLVWVACATGELVALPSAGGAATSNVTVERDLRDVIVNNGAIAVSEFRSAQVLRLAGDGTITRRDSLPSPVTGFVPHVAWRAVPGPAGTIVTLHQAESTSSLVTTVQGGYGCGGGGGGIFPGPPPPPPTTQDLPLSLAESGIDLPEGGPDDAGPDASDDAAPAPGNDAGCPPLLSPMGGCGVESGAVQGVLTVIGSDGSVLVNVPIPAVLPVDVAVSPDGAHYTVVAPGNAFVPNNLNAVLIVSQCGNTPVPGFAGGPNVEPIAVAYDAAGDLLVQTREPATLWVVSAAGAASISLSTTTRADTGFDIFHVQAGGMIACASCHPEGGDDGHVWLLDGNHRRTPSLRGTIAGTAPYHWPGDEPNLTVLVNDVYTVRMSGSNLSDPQMSALTGWVSHVAPPPAPSWVNAASAARGKALFESTSTGCATCHSGSKLTNNQTVDVGTGGRFQVPPLVGVGWRTPLLHDGCAATLTDRFGACSTPEHGSTGSLSQANIADLVSYLETL